MLHKAAASTAAPPATNGSDAIASTIRRNPIAETMPARSRNEPEIEEGQAD
jgi:hypothetical protein